MVAVGSGVTDIKVGDRVAAVFAHGGYAAERLVPVDRAVKLPDNISHEQAAGMMLKGMTAEYLVRRTFKVEKGQTILMHAAAGGVGLILCQWAQASRRDGDRHGRLEGQGRAREEERRHHTILYKDEDFVAKVKEITGGKLCDVVYDGVGKTTFPASLDCLQPLGMFVSFGAASGPDRRVQHQHPAVQGLAVRDAADAQPLRREARGPAGDREGPVRCGRLGRGEDRRQRNYALKDARKAHEELESRGTTGSLILMP